MVVSPPVMRGPPEGKVLAARCSSSSEWQGRSAGLSLEGGREGGRGRRGRRRRRGQRGPGGRGGRGRRVMEPRSSASGPKKTTTTTTMHSPAAAVSSFSLLVFFLYFSTLRFVSGQTPAGDVRTLIQFKQQLVADPTGSITTSWRENALDSRGCPQNWYGVNCSDKGLVVSVSLENLALQGEIGSGTLGRLTGLTFLSLSNNSFKGQLPDDLGSLTHLKNMNLSNNRFEGPIPSSLVKLTSLTNLSLAVNGLKGAIPTQLPASLNELDLSQNMLDGQLPTSLAQLDQLVALNLSNNLLSGSIPKGLGNLSNLKTLDLHGNRLTDSIDPAFFNSSNIRFLDLSSNNLGGLLSWQQSRTSNHVEHLNLSHNQLFGTLTGVDNLFLSDLKVLDISDNRLDGDLPNFQFAYGLTTLKLNKNAFSGSIPSTLLTTLPMLAELDLSMNQLTGNFLSASSPLLTTINLSNNQLSGSLPSGLGPCQSLDLSNNNFTGDLLQIQNWQQLQVLDLSRNELAGYVRTLSQLLEYLNLSYNRIVGPLPDFEFSKALGVVDLSFNQFDGIVPQALFYSPALTHLLLSHNQFTGPIPLSDLHAPSSLLAGSIHLQRAAEADATPFAELSVLDLSSNNLNGSVPPQLGSFSSLQNLNLSANRLSGTIPSQLDNLKSLRDFDLSENQLSGPLPDQLSPSLTEFDVFGNNLSGTVPDSLMKFPRSSFFPGNSGLIWRAQSPPQRSPPKRSRSNGSGMKSGVKAGLIAGCTAGAVLVIAIGTFLIYHHRSSKSHDNTPASEIEETHKGLDRGLKPASHPEGEFEGDIERGAAPAGAGLPVMVTGKSASSTRGKNTPIDNGGSPEMRIDHANDVDSPAAAGNHWIPIVTEDVMSPEHPLAAKVSPEHPIEMKVASPEQPEQLVGDLFFLDKTLSFSAEDLSRAPAEVLGRSNHGISYKASLGADHVLVVKWLKGELAKSRKEFGMEAKKFGNVKHPNIVAIKGYYWGPREHEKLILSDYVGGGSLSSRLQERTESSLPSLTWLQRLKVAVDVSRGLSHLHATHRWAHGNIKASNILLTADTQFEARLSDYGLHRLMTSAGITNQVVNLGALGYCAPELSMAKKPKPSMKADVFSFGVILMELITGKSAGDIISGSTGIVDLPDWVKVVANEGHAIDCYDTALVGVDRDLEPPKGIEQMLATALSCAAPQSSRPTMRVVHERLAAINPD